jgi:TPR repeat protein
MAILAATAPLGCKRVRQTFDLMQAVACADGDKEACREEFDDTARRCDAGEAFACLRHGLQHENERVVPKDETKATALFERACALGHADGCWYAASSHEQGRGVPKDDGKAAELAEKACSGGSVNGCEQLGRMYEFGRGREKDLARAHASYARSCALSKSDAGSGCYSLERLAGTSAPL